jgi:hypothetical protein
MQFFDVLKLVFCFVTFRWAIYLFFLMDSPLTKPRMMQSSEPSNGWRKKHTGLSIKLTFRFPESVKPMGSDLSKTESLHALVIILAKMPKIGQNINQFFRKIVDGGNYSSQNAYIWLEYLSI